LLLANPLLPEQWTPSKLAGTLIVSFLEKKKKRESK
jgi:hypothetical protein